MTCTILTTFAIKGIGTIREIEISLRLDGISVNFLILIIELWLYERIFYC